MELTQMFGKSLLSALIVLMTLNGCASAPKNSQKQPEKVESTAPATRNPGTDEIETEILEWEQSSPEPKADEDAEEGANDGNSDGTDEIDLPASKPRKHTIPYEFNQKVAEWIRYFSQKDRERFQRYLDRGEAYREVVEDILAQNNVPTDLYYLGLIESGFNLSAKSSAKAMGVWQFMKSTGHMYGLGVDRFVDERKDPIQATEAAAKHLRDLYREFGSWPLALAAYNAGSGRIRGAIRRAHTRDFWEMVAKRKLPRETMEYVPKFLAARYIGEHPNLFAFYTNEEQKYPDVELVKVPSPVLFETIENKCSIPKGTLSFVNPHYLKNHTHPVRREDEIWVPVQYKKQVESNYSELLASRITVKPEKVTRVVRSKSKAHTVVVKKGQNLQSIARSQGLSVAYLKRLNGLKSSKITVGQRLKTSATEYRKSNQRTRASKKRSRR